MGIVFIVTIGWLWTKRQATFNKTIIPESENTEYNPDIKPNNFVLNVDNKYFSLVPGTKYVYHKQTSEGLEKVEVEVTYEKKTILGISATIVRDRVFLNNELIEDTLDWYAQDNEGNVWYLGEDVSNYENGKLVDHKGAWEAGVDGAKPGIIMPANPQVGESYRQEYYKGEAEDMGEIISIDKTVRVPYGNFENCLQTRDWSLVDTSANEYKYYCPGVGFTVLTEHVGGDPTKEELVSKN